MIENKPSTPQPDLDKDQKIVPYESLLSQVVVKIKDQPFLFVIAIAALLIGLTGLAAGIGSPDLRFFVIVGVIAVLAFVVIIGYYLIEVRKDSGIQTNAKVKVSRDNVEGEAHMASVLSDAPSSTNRVGGIKQVLPNISANKNIASGYDLAAEILETRQTFRASMTELTVMYYKQKLLNEDNMLFPDNIYVLSKKCFLPDEPLELREIERTLTWTEDEPSVPKSTPQLDLLSILNTHSSENKLYDGFLYRILATNGKEFLFCSGNYFDFLNTCESLSYELSEAIIRHQFAYNILKEEKREEYHKVIALLTENDQIIPIRSSTSPFDFRSRYTAFGTCTLVVIKRSKKPSYFVLNTRSNLLSETPGLTHVIPAGTFQPNFQDDRFHQQEFSFTENIFREFAEELLDDHYLRGDAAPVFNLNDLYSDKVKSFRREIVEPSNFELFYLGLVIDPINLKPEILTVFMVHEAYMKSICGNNFEASWETQGTLNFHDFTKANLHKVINSANLVPTGKAHLWLVDKHYDYLAAKLANL